MIRSSRRSGKIEEVGDPYVVFRVSRQEFALPSARVHEIRTLPPHVSALSDSDIAVAIDLHGQSIPVVDLARCLGQPRKGRRGRRFAIVLPFDFPDGRRSMLGLGVDAVSSVVHIPLTRISPPEATAPGSLTGRVRINGRFKYILEPDLLLPASEVAAALGVPPVCSAQ